MVFAGRRIRDNTILFLFGKSSARKYSTPETKPFATSKISLSVPDISLDYSFLEILGGG